MSQLDPEDRQPPATPLSYRAAEDDLQPGESWKVLLFMSGMILGIIIGMLGAGLGIGGVIAADSPSQGKVQLIAILIGLFLLFIGAWTIIAAVKVKRRRRRKDAFLLGLLCGLCTASLVEGLCFTAIGLSQ